MSDLKIKGIILRKTAFSESDIIFDVLSDEGKMLGFFGRGARRLKSKFAGVLQLGLIVTIHYSTGKNLNYPQEINVDHTQVYSFYSRSLQHMHFYTDLLTTTRVVAKDLEDPQLFENIAIAFKLAEQGNDLYQTYNNFMEQLLHIIEVDTTLICYFSGEAITEKEFYYIPESNRVASLKNKPRSIDVPQITYDEVFHKTYLQRLMLEHVQQKLKFTF